MGQVCVDGRAHGIEPGLVAETGFQLITPDGGDVFEHRPVQSGLGSKVVRSQATAVTGIKPYGRGGSALKTGRVEQFDRCLDHAGFRQRSASNLCQSET